MKKITIYFALNTKPSLIFVIFCSFLVFTGRARNYKEVNDINQYKSGWYKTLLIF